MVEEQLRLREVQGVRAGNINRVDSIALRQIVQRRKQLVDGIIARKGLRLFKAARVNRGEFILARFMGGIDKLFCYPVCANNSETYHKR